MLIKIVHQLRSTIPIHQRLRRQRSICYHTNQDLETINNMKLYICLLSFIITPLLLFCQSTCHPIQKFYADQYYCVQNNHEKNVYCVRLHDTIKGIRLSDNLYEFRIGNDSSIVAFLSRKWTPLRPLWNTFLTTRTISLLPVGCIKYVYNGDTIQIKWNKSAYVGPRYVSSRKKKKK